MKRLATLALAALVSACDGSSGPIPVAEVEIRLNAASVDERTLLVGDTLQLTARLADRDGNQLTGRRVEWESSVPTVATVTDNGLVTAVSAGETLVTATAEGISDQVLIIVQDSPGALACAEGDAGLSLAVGQVHATSAEGSPVLCIAGGSAGSEYVLVPFNAAAAANMLQVEVAANGVVAAIGPPTPALLPGGAAPMDALVPTVREDFRFHERLRERERRELTPLVGRGTEMRPMLSTTPGPSFATASTGDTLQFNVNAEQGCTNPQFTHGVVMAVSQRAIIVADTANPAGGFTQAEYAQFATTFDTLVYPTVTANFGTPSDIDDNGERSIVLFTKAVNELTPPNSQSFVGGFFFSRDLFPKTATETMQACPASNEAEMFYMLVPDPEGEVNNNKRSKEFVAERTVGVLAHEFQHLINASRRLFVVQAGGASWNEDTWLNEGLSHIAEELVFYASTSLQPRQNIGIDELRANSATFDHFVEYQWSNFSRFIEYMKTVANQSALGVDASDQDLPTRGAIWAFLRYAADRKGGSDSALWKSMVDTDRTGLSNLNQALDNQTFVFLRDWTASVYTDDAVPTPAPYQQPSWNYREIITSLRSASTNQPLYPTFPLDVEQLASGESNREVMNLQGGGANYLRFGVGPDGRAAVRATSGGLTAPSRLQLTLVRTK